MLNLFTRPADATPEDAEYYCYSGDSCPKCHSCDLAFDDLCCHNCGWAPLNDTLVKAAKSAQRKVLTTASNKVPIVIDLT